MLGWKYNEKQKYFSAFSVQTGLIDKFDSLGHVTEKTRVIKMFLRKLVR